MCAQIEDIALSYPLNPNQGRDKGYQGIGLAILNSFAHFPRYKREGAEEDENILSQLFASLNLEFRPHYDLTKKQIVELLEKIANDPKLSSDSMIAIAISSHGCEEGLLGTNIEDRSKNTHNPNYKNMEDCIPSLQIQEIFNGENCKGLAGKPKLFLLNRCRGIGIEKIVQRKREEVKEIFVADDIPPTSFSEEYVATTWSDFFVMHSCFPGKISIRSNLQGSLFLVEFTKVYAKYGHKYPIESMMPTVNRNLIKVCKKKGAESAQCCTWGSTCTRSLLIPPTNAVIEPIQQSFPTYPQTDLKVLAGPRGHTTLPKVGNESRPKPSPRKPITNKPKSSDSKQISSHAKSCASEKVSKKPISSLNGLVAAKSGKIYVADPSYECIRVLPSDIQAKTLETRPKAFSVPNHLLTNCWGMCIKNDLLFVSCDKQILKLSSSSGKLLNSRQTDTDITGLDVDDNNTLYVCERFTCKIQVLDMDLNIVRDKLDLSVSTSISASKDRLLDIKVFSDAVYVLLSGNKYTIQMFDKDGHHIIDMVSRELLKESYFFTMDRNNRNIFAGDVATSELKAFSSEHRNLLWKIPIYGENPGDLAEIMGIDLNTKNEVFIAYTCNTKCKLYKYTSLYNRA